MRRNKVLLAAGCSLIWTLYAMSQTKVDLRNQSQSVDFSGAPLTKVARLVTALPATCGVGEVAFLSTAPAGQNLYICPALNTWFVVGGASPSNAGGINTTNPRSAVTVTSNTITMAPGTVQSSAGTSIYVTSATITVLGGADTGQFQLGYNSAGQRICYASASGMNMANYLVAGFGGNACTLNNFSCQIYTAASVQITNGILSIPIDYRPDAFVIGFAACGSTSPVQ
jgi:hypothetical protein